MNEKLSCQNWWRRVAVIIILAIMVVTIRYSPWPWDRDSPWTVISAISTAGAVIVSLVMLNREIYLRKQSETKKSLLVEKAITGDLENILPLVSQIHQLLHASMQQELDQDGLRKFIEKIQGNGQLLQTPSIDKIIEFVVSLTEQKQRAALTIWATIPALSRRCSNMRHVGVEMYKYRDAAPEVIQDIKKIVQSSAIFLGERHPALFGLAGLIT
jgi:hypothetical protein